MWRVLQNRLLYVFLLCTVAPALAGGVRLDPQAGWPARRPSDRPAGRSQPYSGAERMYKAPEYAERFLPASLGGRRHQSGLPKSAYWLRLTVQAPQDHIIRNWLLELAGFPRWIISAPILWTSMAGAYQTGDMLTFDQRPYPHRHFIFPCCWTRARSPPFTCEWNPRAHSPLPVMIWTEPALLV